MSSTSPEMESLKSKLKSTWMTGDYGHFAKYLEPPALEFLAGLAVPAGASLLDVACGAGQIAIPAAQSGIRVTGVDIATNLIEQARARAAAEQVDARFDEGDAEALPYDDASFDIVVSLFGAMFAPRPDRVTAELLRVCRSGGRIVMGNWTPEGHVGRMFKIIGKHVPPPPLMVSPVKWGDEATVRERFRDGVAQLSMVRGFYAMKYPFPPTEVVEFFRTYYGPTNRAFAALDAAGSQALRHDLETLWSSNNQAKDGSTHVEAEILYVTAIRQ